MEGLHKTARAGDYDGTLELLQEGEDVNQVGQYNLTPLHLASLHGKKDVSCTRKKGDGVALEQ